MKDVPAPIRLWPALIALNGFGFAVDQAGALELGEITVHSTLGQPLRASIAYALARNEMVEGHCIFVRPPATTGIPVIRDATVSAANGTIRVAGSAPLREPILSFSLTVDCPGTAHLSRDYTVFVDPSITATADVAEPGRASVTARRADAVAAVPARRRASPAAAEAVPIRGQSTYRVQPGDTLSGIAARIQDRDISLWSAVDVIFAANPAAFIDNDRNRIKAGSLLVLPEMGPVTAAEPSRPATARTATVGDTAPSTAAGTGAPGPAPATTVRQPVEATAAAAEAARSTTPSLRTGDGYAGTDNPFVSPVEPEGRVSAGDDAFGPARDVIPDKVEAAGGRQLTPRVSVAPRNAGDGLGSLAWLGGTGIAIILALLLFGRRLRDRFGSPGDLLPAGIARGRRRMDLAAEPATRLADDDPTDTYQSPMRAQPVALDADLESGTGFDDDGEIDVAQDFGFSTSRDLYGDVDLELPAESARQPGQSPTDVIPPKRFEDRRFTDTVIVEQEIPPSDETGEYDLSMIVDATRQPIEETGDTAKDLRAVQVDTGDDEALDSNNLTLSHDVDYKILEQDYEEELTATQALNAKLARKATRLADAEDPEATRRFESSEAPTAEYVAIDEELTMQLPGGDDYTTEMPLDQDPTAVVPGALDDSGVNAEVTTELPSADNDETIDVDVESATIDTKKLRAS